MVAFKTSRYRNFLPYNKFCICFAFIETSWRTVVFFVLHVVLPSAVANLTVSVTNTVSIKRVLMKKKKHLKVIQGWCDFQISCTYTSCVVINLITNLLWKPKVCFGNFRMVSKLAAGVSLTRMYTTLVVNGTES